MFALRKINNQYKDFAGTRSDFVVVGHPEFNFGKKGCENGYEPKWDTTPIRCHPARSLPADRMRKAGTKNHVLRMTQVSSTPSLKTRALSRSATSFREKGQMSIADGGSFQTVDDFMRDLTSSETLPPIGMQVTAGGYANHIRSQPKCKHYNSVLEDLTDIRRRSQSAPQKVREELLVDDAWRYFASHLEQSRRREAQHKKLCDKAVAGLSEITRQPSGAHVDPMKCRGGLTKGTH